MGHSGTGHLAYGTCPRAPVIGHSAIQHLPYVMGYLTACTFLGAPEFLSALTDYLHHSSSQQISPPPCLLQDLHKQALGRVTPAVPNATELASPGKPRTRQSHRLATIAEAHGKPDSQTVQPPSAAASVSVNSAHGVADEQRPQQGADADPQQQVSTRQNKLQRCPGQLSQATLEASANTLRTLVRPLQSVVLHAGFCF